MASVHSIVVVLAMSKPSRVRELQRTAIPGLIAGLSKVFSYEPGMVVAEGNLVTAHGRYVGWGTETT